MEKKSRTERPGPLRLMLMPLPLLLLLLLLLLPLLLLLLGGAVVAVLVRTSFPLTRPGARHRTEPSFST
jgi:hypothetical protein